MNSRKRILFVEDIDSMRESYLANLRRENFRADGAANLLAAIEAIDRCTYHVAIVDIMLAGPRDTTNRDGVEVLKYVRNLNEGTRAIVLSAQQGDLQLVSDSYKEYGVFGYLLKSKVQNEGVSLLIKTIQEALIKCPVDTPLTWNVLAGRIAWPIGEPAFVSQCLRLLDFGGGADNLLNSLLTSCNSLMPLLLQNDKDEVMVFDASSKIVSGTFWSKGQGGAVEILLWGRTTAGETVLNGRNILYSREKAGLSVAVVEVNNLRRSDFSIP